MLEVISMSVRRRSATFNFRSRRGIIIGPRPARYNLVKISLRSSFARRTGLAPWWRSLSPFHLFTLDVARLKQLGSIKPRVLNFLTRYEINQRGINHRKREITTYSSSDLLFFIIIIIITRYRFVSFLDFFFLKLFQIMMRRYFYRLANFFCEWVLIFLPYFIRFNLIIFISFTSLHVRSDL